LTAVHSLTHCCLHCMLVSTSRVRGSRRAVAEDLQDDRLVPGTREVRHAGRFCVEASWRQGFEFLLVEASAVAEVPCPRDHRGRTIIGMIVGFDAGVGGHAELDGVQAFSGRVALEHAGLDTSDPGGAGPSAVSSNTSISFGVRRRRETVHQDPPPS
jgi:hypothetical protein